MKPRNMICSAVLFYTLLSLSATNSENDVATKLNQFNVDMYKEITNSVSGNIMFSSFSMYTAFAMVAVGAKGKTMDQMSQVFNWKIFDSFLQEMKPMYDHLNRNASKNESLLAIANKLWVADDITLLKTYAQKLQNIFAAVADKENFNQNSDTIRQKINKWVEVKTYDNIKDLFPPNSITGSTRLVLANAIYFKGKWKIPFNKKYTSTGDFYLSSSKKIPVDFMKKTDLYAMYKDQGRNVEVLEIPYSGDKFSMIFIKPTQYNLGSIENAFDVKMMNEWVGALDDKRNKEKIEVSIPKFELMQSLTGVIKLFKNLGLVDLFTADADLSGINGNRDLFCSAVVHKAFIKIDEEGTTAAAATGIVISRTAHFPTKRFTLDRPFLFYIIDKKYKVILFSGRVTNPDESESTISADAIKLKMNLNNSGISLLVSLITILYPIITIIFLI